MLTYTGNNAWIEWHGGEMPVPVGTLIQVQHRRGNEYVEPAGQFRSKDWSIDRENEFGADIVAYRIVDPSEVQEDLGVYESQEDFARDRAGNSTRGWIQEYVNWQRIWDDRYAPKGYTFDGPMDDGHYHVFYNPYYNLSGA